MRRCKHWTREGGGLVSYRAKKSEGIQIQEQLYVPTYPPQFDEISSVAWLLSGLLLEPCFSDAGVHVDVHVGPAPTALSHLDAGPVDEGARAWKAYVSPEAQGSLVEGGFALAVVVAEDAALSRKCRVA